jgi:hypothetical protein
MSVIIKDFADIQDAVLEELKIQSDDTITLNRVKRLINQVYIQEVVPYSNWNWLSGNTRIVHNARYASGSATVTPDSTTVTLSTAPPVGNGSYAGYFFAADGFSDIYLISSHTAGSTTIVLTSSYQGNLSTTATFKIWKDQINLPTDCKETSSVWHNYYTTPMEGVGLRKFRDLQLSSPRQEGPPTFYYTGDYEDPTPLTDETEADRYRTLKLYPAIYDKNVTINIDYLKEATELIDDGDEPIMPIEDRVILVYGTLARAWASIARNESMAQLAKADYLAKLARMVGKVDDSFDPPKIKPSSTYVKSRRAPRFNVAMSREASSSSTGYTPISYLENVTINGGNITGNITCNSGVTIDGVDISSLSSSVSDHIADTIDAHDASAISFAAYGDLAADDVQEALQELDDEKVGKAASSTDNAVARFNGTGGDYIQNSGVIIDDSDNMTLPGNLVHGSITCVPHTGAVTLVDNSSAVAFITLSTITSRNAIIDFSIVRAVGAVEVGTMWVVCDGVDVQGATGGVSIGSTGVSFTYTLSGTTISIRYTTTLLGYDATMKYTIRKWA